MEEAQKLEGTLKKWTNYVSRWKQRHFKLEHGILTYHKKEGAPAKMTIDLATCEIKKEKNHIDVVMPNGKHIKLKPDSANQEQWFQLLLKGAYKDRSVSESAPHSRSVAGPYDSNIAVQRQERYSSPKVMEARFMQENLQGNEEVMQNSQQQLNSNLNDSLADVWKLQAEFQEILDQPPQLAPKEQQNFEYFKNLLQLSNQLKLRIAECVAYIENEYAKQQQDQNEIEDLQRYESCVNENLPKINEQLNVSNESDEFEDAIEHTEDRHRRISGKNFIAYDRKYQRLTLPVQKDPFRRPSMWEVIKDSIGKDLSRIAVPVYYNEPIGFLQRFVEDLEYCELIEYAANSPNEELKSAYMAVFSMAPLQSGLSRNFKPFNPLLGETFEFIDPRFKLVSEQVSHHPPISAMHADSELFTFWGQTRMKTAFRGNTLDIHPIGEMHCIINETGDHFQWRHLTITTHNLILGNPWVDFAGTFLLTNHKNNWSSRITLFKKKSFWSNTPNFEIAGDVRDPSGEVQGHFTGLWNSQVFYTPNSTGVPILMWKRSEPPDNVYYYYYTHFALQLNVPPQEGDVLPATDSRLRPDQRELEHQNIQTAIREKNRLEEKQRAARKVLEESGEEHCPRWFKIEDEFDGEPQYVYTGGYWEEKDKGEFTNVPDIY